MARALVVDDHAVQRFVVCNLLQQMGFENVESAASADAALLAIGQNSLHPFDLVICDLQMPAMDGIEFVRRLGGICHTPPALVFVSAFDERVIRAAEMAAADCKMVVLGSLQKPVSLGSLQQVLLAALFEYPAGSVPLAEARRFDLGQIHAGLAGKQFLPFYQPTFDLESVECTGVELLARWNHPEHGILPPAEFSDVFLDQEASLELTQKLLRQGLDDFKQWRAGGKNICLAFNAGWQLLKQDAFIDFLCAETAARQLEPQNIYVEITESEVMSELPLVLGNMARLRLNGFQLALDDFGSGYSNMHVLSKMPLNQLKLDQSLLRGVSSNVYAFKVLAKAVDLANELGLQVVVEGIETELELDISRQLGVAKGQGYFLGRPMSAVDFSARF